MSQCDTNVLYVHMTMSAHIHDYCRTQKCTHECEQTYTHMYVDVRRLTHTHTHTHSHTRTHTHTHTNTHTHTQACMYTRVQTAIHIYKFEGDKT